MSNGELSSTSSPSSSSSDLTIPSPTAAAIRPLIKPRPPLRRQRPGSQSALEVAASIPGEEAAVSPDPHPIQSTAAAVLSSDGDAEPVVSGTMLVRDDVPLTDLSIAASSIHMAVSSAPSPSPALPSNSAAPRLSLSQRAQQLWAQTSSDAAGKLPPPASAPDGNHSVAGSAVSKATTGAPVQHTTSDEARNRQRGSAKKPSYSSLEAVISEVIGKYFAMVLHSS